MKDKIYIQEGAILRIEKTYDNDVCYIRKDYLLEWAKDHQEGEYMGSYTWACYQIFIDKLNEI